MRAAALLCVSASVLGGAAAGAAQAPSGAHGLGAAVSPGSATPAARAARTIELTESASLRLVSSQASTLVEQGQATGTYDCPVTIHLNLASPTRVTGTFVVHPHGGTISGRATARLQVQGQSGYFGGTLTITHGTGSYAHASGSGIGISGKINRTTFSLSVHVNGKLQL